MKNLKFIFVAFILIAISSTFAQSPKTEVFNVKVNFHCANGKALLDKELSKLDGVVTAVADVVTKVVKIEYDPAKQNKEKLVTAIEKIGYTCEFSKEGVKINKACTHDQVPDQN